MKPKLEYITGVSKRNKTLLENYPTLPSRYSKTLNRINILCTDIVSKREETHKNNEKTVSKFL